MAVLSWTAIVLAGQRPGEDPIAVYTGESWKALARVGGEAMLSRVVRALLDAPSIARVLVVAQQPAALTERSDTEWLEYEPRVSFATSTLSISDTVATVAGGDSAPWPVLVTTADHALLTPLMVEDFLYRAPGIDVAVALVERQVLLAAYPGNKRTWLRFRGGAYSGANLFALGNAKSKAALDLWRTVEQDRKKGWRIVGALGPGLLLGAATGMLTLNQAMRRASARLGIAAEAIVLDIPEAAIDVDKPADHRLAEQIIAKRGAPAPAPRFFAEP